MAYRVAILKGDYSSREYQANTMGAAMVWHQHINSFNSASKYALVEIAYPVTSRERQLASLIAQDYANLLGGGLSSADELGLPGVKALSDGERAETIIDGNKEAYISEPLFGSNPAQAAWVVKPENQRKIAQINVNRIKQLYPDGSLIALSVGHKYKTSNPGDVGCALVGTGKYEIHVVEPIINMMAEMLANQSGAATTPSAPVSSGKAEDMKLLDPVPVGWLRFYRLRQPNTGNFFYTSSVAEANAAQSQLGYIFEGIGWDISTTDPTNTMSLHRLSKGGFHLYTPSESEKTAVIADGWTYEGVIAKVGQGGNKVIRLAKGSAHLYTTSEQEAVAAAANGWKREGYSWGCGTVQVQASAEPTCSHTDYDQLKTSLAAEKGKVIALEAKLSAARKEAVETVNSLT